MCIYSTTIETYIIKESEIFMKTKNVKIGNDIYKLTAVPCDIAGAISIELLSNVAPLLVSFMDGNIELVNKELRDSINSEKVMRMIQELINPMILECNGDLINDWKEHFSCKPLTMFKLGWEALRFNCEDFFTFTSGLVNEKNLGQNWKEVMENLKKEGVELPPLFSLLLQNGEIETQMNSTQKEE